MNYIYIYILYKRLLGVLLVALISLSMPLSAAKINIHITTGGPGLSGIPTRLPSYVGSTPAPIVPGTVDILDCHAIVQENPDYLKTTEAGALCNAIAQLQKYIQDPVELDIEFVMANLVAIGQPSALGSTRIQGAIAEAKRQDENQYAHGYNLIVSQLKKKNAQDSRKFNIVNHLPNYNDLNLILHDIPFYQNNPDYPDNKWKPGSIELSSAQLKALGVRPNFNLSFGLPSPNYKNANIDFGFILADNEVAGAALRWDLDLSDGVGIQGPYTRDVYNSIDFTNPATWPSGFSLSPSINDFQGVVIHELMHGLGFITRVDRRNFSPPPAGTTKLLQSGTIYDLFRFKQSDVDAMQSVNDFRTMPRFWTVDDIPYRFCNQDKGTAVAVLDFDKDGPVTAPLANGLITSPANKGDGRQASHFRSSYNMIPRNSLNDCNSGADSVTKGLFFFEDPPGRMMRPAQGPHNPNLLTPDDLTMLDLIGWNIDYDGNQPTVLDPYDSFDLNSALISQEEFENANGVQLQYTEYTIFE